MKLNNRFFVRGALLLACLLVLPAHGSKLDTGEKKISMSMRDTGLAEVMQMLSRQQRVNILLSNDVEANVSFNLYEVTLDEAITAIASAAGYAVERRDGNYFIVKHESTGKYAPNGLTVVRSFEVQYADSALLQTMLTPYLSDYGELTILADRRLVVVEDTPQFVGRIARLLKDIDRKPRQILIEAQILEITLDDDDAFGIDWKKLFSSDGGTGEFGTTGLTADESTGFFFDLATPDIEVALDALRSSGRVRTLSTPKLLALENQESEVLIGDRKGYRVTTTINQVTSESIEFLESGVILRVIPSIDADGGIMLDIHPEVSTGTVDSNGIPSQTTTEVTTQLLVANGQSVFIGGLLKHTLTEKRAGVPILSDVPGLKRLFSNRRKSNLNTETIVLITPRIVDDLSQRWNTEPRRKVQSSKIVLTGEQERVDDHVTTEFPTINKAGSDTELPEMETSQRMPDETEPGRPATITTASTDPPAHTRVATARQSAPPPIAAPDESASAAAHVTTIPASTTPGRDLSGRTSSGGYAGGTHTVDVNALRVRLRPDFNAGVLAALNTGDRLTVQYQSGDWSRVKATDQRGVTHNGWVVSRFITAVSDAIDVPVVSADELAQKLNQISPTHFVNSNALRVRYRPESTGGVQATLYYGAEVRVLANSGSWSQVNYADTDGVSREGWMASDFLAPL